MYNLLKAVIFFVSFFSVLRGEFEKTLSDIHSKLKLNHGSFHEEYPEQLLTVTFLPKDAQVLELGGHFGRNSCVIGSILNDSKHLVVLESDPSIAMLLQENRNLNGLGFYIEPSALSRVPLIQNGCNSIPGDNPGNGYFKVNTISFEALESKYNRTFDTLVVDAEGALYYILKDDPSILNNIKLIITENDYHNIDHLRFVQSQFVNAGFELICNRSGGWDPCYSEFYQVWKRKVGDEVIPKHL